MKKPVKLSEKVFLIDDFDLKLPERTGTYVLFEEKITLVETSASPSIPYILDGLDSLAISPEDVEYIIVTHIHLDHAGGAGLILEYCPNAKIVVHPKGARHLANPSRLIQGARAVYGDKFDELFKPIIPVPEEKIMIKEDGDILTIGENTTLQFLDTPGHANHHFSVYHPPTKGIFTGDTAGIFYPQLYRQGIEFYLPTTSPNQFDPGEMMGSISRFKHLGIERIYFGHYGMSENPVEAFSQVENWLRTFLVEAESVIKSQTDRADQAGTIAGRLYDKIKLQLIEKGIKEDDPIFELLQLDVNVSAMGLADYFRKQQEGTTK
ncbi:MBL fold metallo-hydrolase [Bacillus sp. REN3]|uniref:MBL fold metallo-hydrolase n=1 Tax=Bacillus sp. REN3 TaxID=2802440 RepID=UPI001AED5EA6|nr:MBL fold metallo-hydrolase [Bacillus sp. REN3]